MPFDDFRDARHDAASLGLAVGCGDDAGVDSMRSWEGDDDSLSDDAGTSVDALLVSDPFAMSSRLRRNGLVALQRLAARVAAVQGEFLVAECGAAPRVRQVEVEVHPSAGEAESVAAAAGDGASATARVVTVTGASTRTVTFTDECVDELAALLHRTHGSVAHELHRARLLHGPLAPVRDALAAGAITAAHAGGICEQAARMEPAPSAEGHAAADDERHAEFAVKCARLAERVLPVAERSAPGATRSQARRLVAQIDAAAERERRRRAKAHMNVIAVAADDGLASVIATMSAIDAATLIARVDAHASATMASGHSLLADPNAGFGQHRAAAFLDLLGMSPRNCAHEAPVREAEPAGPVRTPATRPSVRAEVQVLVDARVLVGSAAGLGWVQVGSGESAPVDREDILALLADDTTPAVMRRLLVDPASGALVDRGAATYAPNADLIAWLAVRDVTCRFPGCTAKAVRCDVDHVQDFEAGGMTTVANTGLLCRRHHNMKTHAGWTVTDARPDGSCEFISPHGERHQHFPTPLTDLMPDPSPPAPPEPVRCTHDHPDCTGTHCCAPFGRAADGEPYPF